MDLNKLFVDQQLSLKAIGLLAFIASVQGDFKMSVDNIHIVLGEGKRRIITAVIELEEKGLLLRRQKKNESGKYDNSEWIITDNPFVFREQSDKKQCSINHEYLLANWKYPNPSPVCPECGKEL